MRAFARRDPTVSMPAALRVTGLGPTVAASRWLADRQLCADTGRSPKWGVAEKFDR